MMWNWQKADWPDFSFDCEALAALETRFVHEAGIMVGARRHLAHSDSQSLAVELISLEAQKTSAIEGEFLNRDSLQSSIRRQFGLQADRRHVGPREQGISEMMVDLYQNYASPLTHEVLFAWHLMLTRGRRDLKNMGAYRSGEDPMQVVSGAPYAPKVHFEAPPSAQIPAEMEQFLDWFQATSPAGKQPLPCLARAGIAHLYFVSIHPFEDGNGRVGRAIAEKALAENLGHASLTALSYQIEKERKRYYQALAAANRQNEVTAWLLYFSETVLKAQTHTQEHIQFLIEKVKLFERLGDQLNDRQTKALLRLFREGPDGFQGGLSAHNYQRLTKASPATATRDLSELVNLGALTRTGERRYTRYWLAIAGQDLATSAHDEG